MKKVLVVVGTRPEAIKMAPVIRELATSEGIEQKVLATGQHRQMLDGVLELFAIKPDYDLNVMSPGQDLADLTSRVLQGSRDVLCSWRPDLVLVHGDTTSSMAAALAAFYLQVPVGHVEAGLRTYDMSAPFPEELNRQVISKVSKYHFCPTKQSLGNLEREGVSPSNALVTGNTVIDALFAGIRLLEAGGLPEGATRHSAGDRPFVLVTGHRRENFGASFRSICSAIRHLAGMYPGWDFVYPVHLNPSVQEPVRAILSGVPNVRLLPPLDYLPFLQLMRDCRFVLTDSGGIQEEAPSLGKPVLLMRTATERPEAVAAGTVRIVGSSQDSIVSAASLLMASTAEYQKMQSAQNPYGDGLASQRIRAFIESC
jgi:UDP-N-acetylglucosamine 2-epimerase (non-hydrolysing)